MSSPAEPLRAPDVPALSEFQRFRGGYDFDLDGFQIEGCRALEAGDSVLVAAPTGSGKTVVGEFAVHLALAQGVKCFYTTPIKALSNQKYADLVARHGAANVGLLTGDNTVNGEAPVVVMTTEVLRNMLYAGSGTLSGLGYVVMDEVHYLADRFRGAVWEEVIIHLPESVRLIALSATVSNVEEFAGWLRTVRGDTKSIVWEHRPVPLWQHVLSGRRMFDLFANGADGEAMPGANGQGGISAARELRVNPELVRLNREGSESMYKRGGPRGGGGAGGNRGQRGRNQRRGRGGWVPSRVDVIEKLDTEGLLPAITFIFSRAGCDAAVQQFLHAGVRLLNADERARVKAHVLERTGRIPSEDLNVLGFHDWFDGLQRGVAAHHAGMLPTFKEIVEELFVQGLVKAVFATETLALGINMPARTVVMEALTKWNGENHVDLTAGEYTQLTGRAGRRGIDIEGHAVVLYRPDLDVKALAGLAGTRTYPLRSSFKPSYNMAVNLVGQFGAERARNLLETSFAQYQADQAVVGLTRQVRKNANALEGYSEAITCHLGDFDEYMALRRQLSEREADLSRQGAANRTAAALESLEKLQPGDIIVVPAGKRAGVAVVLDPGIPAATAGRPKQVTGDGPRPVVLTVDRQVVRLSVTDFPTPAEPLERMRIPKSFNAKSPQSRKDLAAVLRSKAGDKEIPPYRKTRYRSAAADDTEISRLRKALRAHPCHGCQDREDHARWAERYHKLDRETKALEKRVAGRTNSIARVFDRVCGLLEQLGYLDGDQVTPIGKRLGRLYTELDLLTAETLRAGLWEGLTPPELAACVSALVYEARRADDAGPPRLPGGAVPKTLDEMVRLWAKLEELETDHHLEFQREPDLGFALPAFHWASGKALEEVLWDVEMPAGDFVRWCKQLIDLLGQVANAAAELTAAGGRASTVRGAAQEAIDGLRRGVVAYSMMNG
ncbi:ATP-dependent RNA helicase HelY [Catenulispora sp. GP43]|uniref:DEAD/DEAH box helicase n=1 Tax=Catenulispora sp. GP43 TaxID=3156263 RepID=UPI0035165BE5